jgi:hypothetical protein
MKDRRKEPRIPFQQAVEVKFYDVSSCEDLNEKTVACRIKDISEQGVRLCLDYFLPVGTTAKMRVSVADPPSAFTHDTKVRWISRTIEGTGFNVGFEFTESSQTHAREWRGLLKEIERTTRARACA